MLTDDEILDLVRECDLDWHAGFSIGSEDNRLAMLARAVERAAAERMRERCMAACDEAENAGRSVEWLLVAIRAIKIEGETR